MKKYSIENTSTLRDFAINSIVIEQASIIAETIAMKEWCLTNSKDNFYVKEGDDLVMCEEAQDIFNNHYDKEVDRLYGFVNNIIEIDKPTEKELKLERLSNFICDDDVKEAYNILEKAVEEGKGNESVDYFISIWQPLENRYTVLELLNEL